MPRDQYERASVGPTVHARFRTNQFYIRASVGDQSCVHGLVRLWLRYGTLLGALGDLRTSGVAVPVVHEA